MPERDRRRLSGRRPGLTAVSLERRRALQWLALPASQLLVPDAWSMVGRIGSARLWPAQEYTRLILESSSPITWQMIALRNPDRVVLDLADIDMTEDLAALAARVHPGDPYVAAVRFGRPSSYIQRIVLDLKTEVKASAFALKPVAEFGHRLVLDLNPTTPVDPLMALLDSERARAAEAAPPPPASPPAASHAANPAAPQNANPAPTPPAERAAAADGGAPARPANRAGPRRITIAIDPGHGGEDPGAIGRRGTYEKNVALAISRRLKRVIDAEPNMRAMMTRDDDYFVPLAARVQKARRVQADLFVSIHADAFREPQARGSSVFALSEHGATSAAARWLAQKENAADLIGGVNLDIRDPVLARMLLEMSQTAQINDSLKVGRQVLAGIGTHNALHKASVEQAGFAVLKAPDIPSILVETAFISNPEEELKLRSDRHQQKFADSIGDGIRRYFSRNPPLARA